jgi:hypothetical protein
MEKSDSKRGKFNQIPAAESEKPSEQILDLGLGWLGSICQLIWDFGERGSLA